MKFGDNLRKLRKLKKLSQEELAEKMQVSRQSVSKWETSESYPEMNNILELCKIFHCHINDLVNDNIIDINSLDEEIKMNVVKFKKEQQNKMKSLSNAIFLISKICKILVAICIPIIVISIALTIFLISQVNFTDNEISFNNIEDKIKIIEKDNNISIMLNDKSITSSTDKDIILKIRQVLNKNSKLSLSIYVTSGLFFLIIYLILIMFILNYLEKLFFNINKGNTPFTLENVNYIKKIAYIMIAIIIVPNIIGLIFELILNTDLNIDFEMFSLIEILFLFSMAYIFQYGYEIQLDSKGKMYGEE